MACTKNTEKLNKFNEKGVLSEIMQSLSKVKWICSDSRGTRGNVPGWKEKNFQGKSDTKN